MKKKSIIAAAALAAVFAAVFLFAGWRLITLHLQNSRQQKTFDQLSEEYAVPLPQRADSAASSGSAASSDSTLPVFGKYPDMAAWISIEGTKVDYPVMLTPEHPNYYLRRDLSGAYSSYGVPYLQENCDPDGSDNLIVYGHAFKNGDMFGSLKNYAEKSFWEKHHTIRFVTPSETREYTIAAVFKVNVDDEGCFAYWNFTKAQSKADYDGFVRQAKALSFYETDILPEYGQQLLTLSTCEYSYANGRLVVVAVRTA